MKKLILLTIFVALTIYGCKKSDNYDPLYGTWKILGISGGFTGFQTVRDFDELTLNQSGSYFVKFNDLAIQGGSFRIEKQDPIEYKRIRIDYHIHFSESYDNHPNANFYPEFPMEIYFFGNDTLTLRQAGMSEGFNYHFARR